jgi:hypothetical protein
MPLPEKDFFTIDEVLDRWRYAQIDRATLLNLAVDDLLVFSVYLRDLGHHWTSRDTPQGRVTTTNTVEFEFRATGYERPQLQYLCARDARRLLESNPGEQIGVSGLYSLPTRAK